MEIRDIKRIIRAEIDPVALNLGLAGPHERVHNNVNFSLDYLTEDIGLEIRVDLGDFFVYAIVFKTDGKSVPAGYKNNSGQRQKMFFQEALRELSLGGDTETKELQKLGGDYRNCKEIASTLAKLIKDKWSSVVTRKKDLFPGL